MFILRILGLTAQPFKAERMQRKLRATYEKMDDGPEAERDGYHGDHISEWQLGLFGCLTSFPFTSLTSFGDYILHQCQQTEPGDSCN